MKAGGNQYEAPCILCWRPEQKDYCVGLEADYFVREKGALTWEQAIHKVTGRPAQRLRLAGKGVLAAGMDADLCVFDPEALRETGTYQEPCRMAAGMDTVLAAGVPVLEQGVLTGARPGHIIRR